MGVVQLLAVKPTCYVESKLELKSFVRMHEGGPTLSPRLKT